MGLSFSNIKGAHQSPDLVLPPDQWLGGYCIAYSMQKIQSAKCSASPNYGQVRLRTTISTIWDLPSIKLIYHSDFSRPFLRAPSADHYYLYILHCVSIPMYAAELGVDPQADFTTRVSKATRINSFIFPFRCISNLGRQTP